MKILVVDDSPTARHVIRGELESGGHAVREALSGEEAQELMASFAPDLITLDVEMPGLNGYETCARIREMDPGSGPDKHRNPRIPIIFITANDTLIGRIKGFEAGATDFIKKPFSKGALLKTVETILQPEAIYAGFGALVVDDSKVARLIMADLLKSIGLEVFEAENGREGLEFLTQHPERVDLLISGLHMPYMDGLDFCREIRNGLGLQDLPILILSADTITDSEIEMFKAGANDFVSKPFTKEVMMARVHAQLRNRRTMRALNHQVRELQRLNQLKDDFVAITSQDLRSPLATILTSVDMLRTQRCTPDESAEFLESIHRSGSGLLNLIDDLIVLSKLQTRGTSLKMKAIPLFEELKQSLEPYRAMLRAKALDLTINNDFGSSPIVMGNVDALFSIMDHLMSNAIEHSPLGGAITVKVKPRGTDAVAVSVKDQGPGLSKEQVRTLFQWVGPPTHQKQQHLRGMGLGLLIVHDLVQKQNATIQVFSKPGEGTKIEIVFPLAREALSA